MNAQTQPPFDATALSNDQLAHEVERLMDNQRVLEGWEYKLWLETFCKARYYAEWRESVTAELHVIEQEQRNRQNARSETTGHGS